MLSSTPLLLEKICGLDPVLTLSLEPVLDNRLSPADGFGLDPSRDPSRAPLRDLLAGGSIDREAMSMIGALLDAVDASGDFPPAFDVDVGDDDPPPPVT